RTPAPRPRHPGRPPTITVDRSARRSGLRPRHPANPGNPAKSRRGCNPDPRPSRRGPPAPPRYNRCIRIHQLERAMSTPAASALEGANPSPRADATPLRFVTAASLFDGHDAAINIMRRLIQSQGAEVIHLGHNRSVEDVVRAALQEDADAIALSSYQGGHVEYMKY